MFKSFSQSQGRFSFRRLFGRWSLSFSGRWEGERGLRGLSVRPIRSPSAQHDSGRWTI